MQARMRSIHAFFLLLSLLAAAPVQAQVTTADLVGTVTDSSGAVVVSAQVTATNEGTVTGAVSADRRLRKLPDQPIASGAVYTFLRARGIQEVGADGHRTPSQPASPDQSRTRGWRSEPGGGSGRDSSTAGKPVLCIGQCDFRRLRSRTFPSMAEISFN